MSGHYERMTAPTKTYLSPNKTIAMRASPGVILQVLSGQVTRADFEASAHVLDLPLVGERYVQLCRIAATGVRELPDDDFRNAAAKSLRERSSRIAGFAYVVIGDGFLSSMARAVITGITVLSRPKHPEKVFSNPIEASSWLATQMPGLVPEEILVALDELVELSRS